LYPDSYFQETEKIRLNIDNLNNGIDISQNRASLVLSLSQRNGRNNNSLVLSMPLTHYSENDTFYIDYDFFVSEGNRNIQNRKVVLQTGKEIRKIFTKRYSKFLSKSINSQKLESHIKSGEYFNTPYKEIRSIKAFEDLEDRQLDSLWHLEFLNRSFSNRELFVVYLEKLNDQQIDYQINCNQFAKAIKMSSWFYFTSIPRHEMKDRLFSLFLSAETNNYVCDTEELVALYYAYFLISSFGITEETDHPYAINLESLTQLLSSLTNERFKNDFMDFLKTLETKAAIGETKLATTLNKTVQLNDYFDKPYVILDFWATWCRPCIRAFPDLKTFNEQWGEKMNLLSISVDHDFTRFQNWTSSKPEYNWTFLHTGLDHQLVRELNIRAFPTYLIFNTKTNEITGPFHTVEEIDTFLSSAETNY